MVDSTHTEILEGKGETRTQKVNKLSASLQMHCSYGTKRWFSITFTKAHITLHS